MKLKFFDKNTHAVYPHSEDLFVDKDGNVWGNNGDSCESQPQGVDLYDFLIPFPQLYAKVVEE